MSKHFLVAILLLITVPYSLEVIAQPVPGQDARSQVDIGTTQTGASDSGSPNLGELRGRLTVPVQIEPTLSELDVSKGQQWRRAVMQLTGSMCPACLLELEHRLRALPGVCFAAITRASTAGTQAAQPVSEQSGKRTAPTVIIYDARTVVWQRLQQCIKQEKYRAADLNDRPLAPVTDSAATAPPATQRGQTASAAQPGK